MTAGVPGLGLSGLFVLFSALALPLTRRRRQRPRIPIARLFRLAVVMSAAVVLTWEVIVVVFTALHTRSVRAHGRFLDEVLLGHSSLRLPVIVISASIMVMVVAIGEALLRLVGVKPTPTPPPVESAMPPESDL